MTRARGRLGRLFGAAILVAGTSLLAQTSTSSSQTMPPASGTFRSRVDLVRISAVVRNHKGRFVPDLTARDFEVIDDGQRRVIADFQPDLAGVSVALLFDVSGSMQVSSKLAYAREAATHVLSWLQETGDEAAVFTFDTELRQVLPFTTGLRDLPEALRAIKPFGATSLHDAIAETAARVASRQDRRHAVVVLTDGNDNASRLTPAEVSGIASSIDVPIYILGIVSSIDNPSQDISPVTAERSALAGPLTELAAWTGGETFIASTPAQRSIAARQIVDELRHQYLIAFESSGTPGWHPLVVRIREKDLVVRARSGYLTGQTPPITYQED